MEPVFLLNLVIIALITWTVILTSLLLRRRAPDLDGLRERFDQHEKSLERLERVLREEIVGAREETSHNARHLREEVVTSVKTLGEALSGTAGEHAKFQREQLNSFAEQLRRLIEMNEQKLETLRTSLETRLLLMQEENAKKLDKAREDAQSSAKQTREESGAAFTAFNEWVLKSLSEMATQQKVQMENFNAALSKLTDSIQVKMEVVKTAVESKLQNIRDDNTKQLEQMRQTVDEKLQGALEKRLGESFRLVSERLEQVHQGLGEMQNLATGVGDLKRVLTNVKVRGTWGEVQLAALLEQVLSPDQYASSVATKEGSGERVDFAIKLPGRTEDIDEVVWLPIDAKFPQEDYQLLVEAQERGDLAALEAAAKRLEARIRTCAKEIAEKYLNPPITTDFGILFLPTEGLYAEVIRRPGLMEAIQSETRIVIAGPTTLSALLNSLQMGFRTLAIQQRSSEVWQILGAVKTEFGKFGGVIRRVQKKLHEASNIVEQAATRTRAVERKLRDVEELPVRESGRLIVGEGSNAQPLPLIDGLVEPDLELLTGEGEV